MPVKHDIACQLVLILSRSKESALLMINYYHYNHFGSSQGKKIKIKKKIRGVYLEIKCPVSPPEHLGKKQNKKKDGGICNARGSSYGKIRACWEEGATGGGGWR